MTRTRVLSSAVAAAALLLLAVPPAIAGDAPAEIATAAAHAGMAAASGDIKTVHMHLHHVVNCLVGPGGTGFDAMEANPCKGKGLGAIPDSLAGKRMALQSVVDMAERGIAQADLAKAKEEAAEVQAALKKDMM